MELVDIPLDREEEHNIEIISSNETVTLKVEVRGKAYLS